MTTTEFVLVILAAWAGVAVIGAVGLGKFLGAATQLRDAAETRHRHP